MNQFQPLIDRLRMQGIEPELDTHHGVTMLRWTEKPMRTVLIDVTVNGPGTWSENDPTWGGTITITDSHGPGDPKVTESHMTTGNLPDLINWWQGQLHPTERQLNEAWGV